MSRVECAAANNASAVEMESTLEDDKDKKLPELYWMVKPCFQYEEEYADCKSFKARFQQYFVHGETTDCSRWKADFDNCSKWEKKSDEEALVKVIESEKDRVRERLKGHYGNDVWETRRDPPNDWNKTLPVDILEEYETSFLKKKADALKDGTETLGNVDKNIKESTLLDPEEGTMCIII